MDETETDRAAELEISGIGVRLADVSLERDGVEVFSHLNLNLTEHRIGLIGNNGSGKSSLVRLFNGLLRPGRGRITVYGRNPASEPESMAEVVGFIFQNPDHQLIFPTVIEELSFGLKNLGMRRQDAAAAAMEFLERQGRAHWAERPVHSLSDGQKQLVCIFAVLLMEPRLLVLDEPFSALDLPTRQSILQLLAGLPQQVIMISHELESLRSFERIIWIEQGAVRMDGPPETVLDAYRRHAA